MGYLPCNVERRSQTLLKKRSEYMEYVQQSFKRDLDHTIWHQICIDVPRTHPGIKLYQCDKIQKMLERILYCWSIRHPASGYVQGINDLATPFLQVFLTEYVGGDMLKTCQLDSLSQLDMENIEADTFWCLTKLLDGIQVNNL
jgi:hypothetical protein